MVVGRGRTGRVVANKLGLHMMRGVLHAYLDTRVPDSTACVRVILVLETLRRLEAYKA
jgi:glycerol-3-phosphate O-acyltransferase